MAWGSWNIPGSYVDNDQDSNCHCQPDSPSAGDGNVEADYAEDVGRGAVGDVVDPMKPAKMV